MTTVTRKTRGKYMTKARVEDKKQKEIKKKAVEMTVEPRKEKVRQSMKVMSKFGIDMNAPKADLDKEIMETKNRK